MPDFSGIRAAAVACGNVQAAARQAAQALPEQDRQRFIERINKRALRERWLDKAEAVHAAVQADKGLSKVVQNGHELLQDVIKDRLNSGRLARSRYVQRASARAAALPSSKLLGEAPNVKALAGVAEQLDPHSTAPNLRVSIYAGEKPIDATVIECGTVVEPATVQELEP